MCLASSTSKVILTALDYWEAVGLPFYALHNQYQQTEHTEGAHAEKERTRAQPEYEPEHTHYTDTSTSH